ncbi:MAG: peptidoglycan-binding domain-containing protein [Marinosulfonomonas sp.]
MKALYAAAQAKPEEDRLNDYLGVRRLLDLIVKEHPSSDLAVGILLQDTIDGVDIAAIDAAIKSSKEETESTASSDTETANASGEANSAVSPGTSQVAPLPTPDSAAVKTELSEPVRTEKEIVLDIQTELNRVGCAAGTPDGVSGRKTRAAFSSFIKESGVDLSEDDLATEKAVAALKVQEGTICKVRTMASTSASALAGSWGFRSDCPGFGSRVIRNTGSMNMAYQGNNTLRGPARNKQGNTGSAVIQFQGTRTAATIIKFGFVTVKGNLTRSNSNMTISGTGSNNCKIVAWKN